MGDKISGDYIAGFVDGEGCFALSMRKDVRHERKGKPVYYSWKAIFAVVLRKDDYELLKKIKEILNCGSLSFTKKREQVRYQVSNLDELNDVVVPFFKKYKMYGKKKEDFKLWSEAVKVLLKYKKIRGKINLIPGKKGFIKTEWNEKDIDKLLKIHEDMQSYKSKRANKKWTKDNIGRE